MPEIRVNKKLKHPRSYWPKELVKKGYSGKLEVTADACVLVIPKPKTRKRDIAKSLQLLVDDFLHQAEMEKEKESKQ